MNDPPREKGSWATVARSPRPGGVDPARHRGGQPRTTGRARGGQTTMSRVGSTAPGKGARGHGAPMNRNRSRSRDRDSGPRPHGQRSTGVGLERLTPRASAPQRGGRQGRTSRGGRARPAPVSRPRDPKEDEINPETGCPFWVKTAAEKASWEEYLKKSTPRSEMLKKQSKPGYYNCGPGEGAQSRTPPQGAQSQPKGPT